MGTRVKTVSITEVYGLRLSVATAINARFPENAGVDSPCF